VSACMKPNGEATFAINQAEVTREEADNGIHFYLVEADLMQQGFEEPFVHFPESESPAFLLPAVEEYLSLQAGASNDGKLGNDDPELVLPLYPGGPDGPHHRGGGQPARENHDPDKRLCRQ